MRRRQAVVLLFMVAAGTACTANRPQGNAERFLEAVSRGTDLSLVRRLGTTTAVADVLGHPLHRSGRDQKNLDSLEVAPSTVRGDVSEVPALVLRKGESEARRLGLRAELDDGTWRVVSASPLRRRVRFPSEGGPIYGATWPTVLLVGAAVGLVVGTTAVATITWVRRSRGPDAP